MRSSWKWLTAFAAIWLCAFFMFRNRAHTPDSIPHKLETIPSEMPTSTPVAPVPKNDLKKEFNRLLSDVPRSDRTLDLPVLPEPSSATSSADVTLPPDPQAEGRQKRKTLPMGIILWDKVVVSKDLEGKNPLYTMRTGDIIRVYPDSKGQPRLHVQPGVDVFLAATTQNIEAAGRSYPDQDGWVDRDKVQIFRREQAIEFTQTADAMTLTDDPNFSMLSFYERAMKNPDPVVHRMMGPRLLGIVSLHEDYVTSWQTLYRDPDSKIRAYTLAQLKERGVGRSSAIVEDLIVRLTELTKTRAANETEVEVLTIIDILKDSRHSRVPAAFASFREAWEGKQSPQILESLKNL